MKRILLEAQIELTAKRARQWDDKYYRLRNQYDCSEDVAEQVNPRLVQYRLKWEELRDQHTKLQLKLKRLLEKQGE